MQTLIELLEEETKLLQSLVGAAMRQQQALIRLRAPEIEDANAEQEKILNQIRYAERRRIRAISAEFGVSDSEASAVPMSDIISVTKAEDSDALTKLQNTLRGLMLQLQGINSINRVLTHRARSSAREVLSFIEENNVQICNVRI